LPAAPLPANIPDENATAGPRVDRNCMAARSTLSSGPRCRRTWTRAAADARSSHTVQMARALDCQGRQAASPACLWRTGSARWLAVAEKGSAVPTAPAMTLRDRFRVSARIASGTPPAGLQTRGARSYRVVAPTVLTQGLSALAPGRSDQHAHGAGRHMPVAWRALPGQRA